MEIFDRAVALLDEGKFEDVIGVVSNFLDENPKYDSTQYYHFSNPIEEILFDVYLGEIESVQTIDLDENIDELFVVLSIAHHGLGDGENALKYLKTANKINPVSAPILMRLCEFYQERNEEHMIKEYAKDIMKYTYDKDLLVSSYFKLADYYYHTRQEMELYDHFFNFYMQIRTGENMGDVRKDIEYLKSHGVQVGFNEEIIKILLYLIDVHTQQNMANVVEYFKNILYEVVEFNKMLHELENEG